MTATVRIPRAGGTIATIELHDGPRWKVPEAPFAARVAYAAAHVVCDPFADVDVFSDAAIDWDATLAYRHHLWRHGFAIAEAMDTAQRGGGLTWPAAQALISRALAESRAAAGAIACGAGTDHLAPQNARTIGDVIAAYEEQVSFVEGHGGRVILMASRALARVARNADDYRHVYSRVLSQASTPVILHWLGDMFDPALRGYWGSTHIDSAMSVCLDIISENQAKIDGIKISLLDADREVEMRRKLPRTVRMYTGDDFNYPALIAGDGEGHSDALLGIFDGIAPAASEALQALDAGDLARYHEILAPTVALSRHVFRAPTSAYKTGIVFLAYVNGHQNHFRMLGGAESARSAVHLADALQLADRAGLIVDAERAALRARAVFALAGVS